MSPSNLDFIFRPRSTAVIGASNREGSVGRALFSNVLMNSYTGVVYPVNMTAKSVLGVKAYQTVLQIPDEVDLAVLIIPALAVPAVRPAYVRRGRRRLPLRVRVLREVRSSKFEGKAISD